MDPTGPVCAGDWVTFTAYPVNGGNSPTYMWRKNGILVGSNNSTYSCQPLDGDTIKCVLTSNATCASGNTATSNLIPMTVNPLQPVSISISAPVTTVCEGIPVTFTATPANGGTSPSFQWKVNGANWGTNSPFYTYTPSDGDIVTCVLTSDITCPSGNPATSNAVTMTVNQNNPVAVSITADQNNVCTGTQVTFSASSMNCGTTPTYLWKVNEADTGSDAPTFAYAPQDGDIVTCILVSTANCPTGNPATSNPVIMDINPYLPVSVSISASPF